MIKEYDLFLFAGQSNMAGRGIVSKQWPEAAPKLIPGAGYKYRAVSDPGRLHMAGEPFGVNENNPDGIYEPGIRQAQLELAGEYPEIKIVCDDFHTMRIRGLMKDEFHYYQKAYNEVGTAAGNAAGEIVNGL